MYAVQYEICGQKHLLKNQVLRVLGVGIPDTVKGEVIVFRDKKQAEEICKQYKEGEVVVYEPKR